MLYIADNEADVDTGSKRGICVLKINYDFLTLSKALVKNRDFYFSRIFPPHKIREEDTNMYHKRYIYFFNILLTVHLNIFIY